MRVALFAFFAIAVLGCLPAQAQDCKSVASPSETWSKAPEAWVKARMQAGCLADLDIICKPEAARRRYDDPVWQNPCRQISADVIVDPLIRNGLSHQGILIAHARVNGDVDLANAHIEPFLGLTDCKIAGKIELRHAQFDRTLWLDRTWIDGDFVADGTEFKSVLLLRYAVVNGNINFINATVGQNLEMSHSFFRGNWMGDGLRVGHVINIEGARFIVGPGKPRKGVDDMMQGVRLVNAKADLFMGGDIVVDRALVLNEFKVEHDLFLNRAKLVGSVSLFGATIGTNLELTDAILYDGLRAFGVKVGGFSLLNGSAKFRRTVSFVRANLATIILAGAVFDSVDLSGATITGDLLLSEGKADAHWRQLRPGGVGLILRNAHTGGFESRMAAWPGAPQLDLEGFTYERLGSYMRDPPAVDPAREHSASRERSVGEWRKLLSHNSSFSPQPYVHLAAVLTGEGRRDDADAILFHGRERERQEVCNAPHWIPAHPVRCAWMWVLLLSIGYGIGIYSFFALGWAILLLGSTWAVLYLRVPDARRKGIAWCMGASLSRVLPIELNKKFTEFFADSQTFTRRQLMFFSAVTLLSALLGLFVVGAITGLTQKG